MIGNLTQIKRGDILLRSFSGIFKTTLLMSIALLLVSCAPSSYYINMQYQPSKVVPDASNVKNSASVTIANLNDIRPGGGDLQVGTVVTSEGKLIPVIQKDVKPSKAVAAAIADYLKKSGYTLTNETPDWNLQENAIKKEWGKILIGGNIDKLEITCDNKQWVKKYRADVKLSLFFADIQKGRIFYRISATGGASLEHVKLSDETLEQQINGALSSAIEDIFESATFKSKIQEALKQIP